MLTAEALAVTREWLKMKVVVLLLLLVYQIVSGEWMKLPKADVNQLAADITNGVISRLSE